MPDRATLEHGCSPTAASLLRYRVQFGRARWIIKARAKDVHAINGSTLDYEVLFCPWCGTKLGSVEVRVS